LIAIALSVLVSANLLASFVLRRHPVNLGYYVIRSKWQLLDAQVRPVDWLLIGDSSCNQGLRPDVIREVSGETVLNLCTIADTLALSDVWGLKRYVSRVGKPKHVVIAHVTDMWERDDRDLRGPLLAQFGLGFGFWRSVEPKLDLDPREEANVFLAYYAPLYAENVSLLQMLHHPSLLRRPPPAIDAYGYLRSAPAAPEDVLADAKHEAERVVSGRGAISAQNRAALRTLAALAEENQLEVSIVSAPLLDSLWEFAPFRKRHAEVLSAIERELRGTARVRVRVRDPVLFPVSELDRTVDHVGHEGAGVFTRKILEELRRAP
jgi:hypothetical protein